MQTKQILTATLAVLLAGGMAQAEETTGFFDAAKAEAKYKPGDFKAAPRESRLVSATWNSLAVSRPKRQRRRFRRARPAARHPTLYRYVPGPVGARSDEGLGAGSRHERQLTYQRHRGPTGLQRPGSDRQYREPLCLCRV